MNVFKGQQTTIRTYIRSECRKTFLNGFIQMLPYSTKSNDNNVTLTDYQAFDMIHKLTDEDRGALTKALNQYESNKIKSKFQGMDFVFFFSCCID